MSIYTVRLRNESRKLFCEPCGEPQSDAVPLFALDGKARAAAPEAVAKVAPSLPSARMPVKFIGFFADFLDVNSNATLDCSSAAMVG